MNILTKFKLIVKKEKKSWDCTFYLRPEHEYSLVQYTSEVQCSIVHSHLATDGIRKTTVAI